MAVGKAITLNTRYQHLEDSILVFFCEDCIVYLLGDTNSSMPIFVELTFHKTKCVRSARTDCSPAIGIYPEQSGVSFIVELTESPWAFEAHQAYVYAGTSFRKGKRHFVVNNHDVFHEVLAETFTERLVCHEDAKYDFIRNLFNI